MWNFLSNVFAAKAERGTGPDKQLIDRAIERVVDGTDARLRGMGNYRKRLRKPVEAAVQHVLDMVDAFPAPTEISRQAYRADPRLRAFFVSAANLQEVVGGSKAVKEYVRANADLLPDDIFGFLAMQWEEKNVLGMDLSGDTVRRDVSQVAVNFFNHRYVGPAGSEAESRRQVQIRIFDYLIEQALKRIVAARGEQAELKQQQSLLQRKLAAMQAGNCGLEAMFAETEPSAADCGALQSEIQAVEARLLELGTRPLTLQAFCEDIEAILGRPGDWIARRDICLNLDEMLIKVPEASTRRANRLELTELFSCSGERRIVLPGRFPRRELPAQPDFRNG